MPNPIRVRRRAKGLTQAELAKLVGCSRFSVVRWESGEITPAADFIPPLAKALGVDATKLSLEMETFDAGVVSAA